MLWLPGSADFGTLIFWVNPPVLLVVVEPTTVLSKLILTVSLLPKPVPLTVRLVVGGPEFTESVMAGLDARAIEQVEMRRARHAMRIVMV